MSIAAPDWHNGAALGEGRRILLRARSVPA
jgi:hypothetical protein